MQEKRKYNVEELEYQIETNSGETVGLAFNSIEEAEEMLLKVMTDEKFLEELCPDTDLQTITSFAIKPVVTSACTVDIDYLKTMVEDF